MHGMLGHSYTGGISHMSERTEEKIALWFLKTTSGKTIWPGKKYVLVKTFYDDSGRPPIYGQSWDRIYTLNEYLVYSLTKDSKKPISVGHHPSFKKFIKE